MDDVYGLELAGKEESFVFLADSRQRDRAAFPTPSEYQIVFNAPFRNVVGIDLLDATLPRAEYQVETTSNSIKFAATDVTGTETWYVVQVAPGDYSLPQLVDALNVAFSIASPPIIVQPANDPYERTNTLLFSRAYPFKFDMAGSTMRYILGFGDPVTTSSNYDTDPAWTPYQSYANDIFVAKVASSGSTANALLGPAVALDYTPAGLTVRQRFLAQSTGPPSTAAVFVTGSSPASQLSVSVYASSDGGLTFTSLVASGTATAISSDPRQPTLIQLSATGSLVISEPCAIVITPASGSDFAVAYAPMNYVDAAQAAGKIDTISGTTITPFGGTTDQVCVDVLVSTDGFQITSPGVVQLTGERYIVIRSPEIESHMYRDRATERFHSGLGIVKLTGYGYNEQRYDFVSFPKRSIHPIGKFQKFTIRIEKPDGTLYNSHGVDHVLMLVVRYLAIPRSPGLPETPLNPNYNPDFRTYSIAAWTHEIEDRNQPAPKSFGPGFDGGFGATGRT